MQNLEKIEVNPVSVEEGRLIFNIGADAASGDPFVYARAIRANDKQKIEKMNTQKGFRILLENGRFL